jgi:predicted  nucleic acid-binding Zn-ribbon protein
MDTERSFEQQIQVEVEALRAKFPQTQDLYREACVLLFFRFGITPTANKLYQFVRKGSMSAPAEALGKFWDTLREKSRIRVEHPDLPEDLRVAAGDLTAVLWSKAQACAQEGLEGFRSEARATVAEARESQAIAEAERDAARSEAAHFSSLLDEANFAIRSLEQKLAAERATRAGTESQLVLAGQDVERLQASLDEARRDFSAELEKHRAASRLADERSRAAEERALQEIDRERTHAVRLQKELEQVRVSAGQAATRHQTESSALHIEIGQLRQKVGVLEGNLEAARSERDRVSESIETLRDKITEAATHAAAARADADNWRKRAEELQQAMAAQQVAGGRRARKATLDKKDPKQL